MSLGSCGVVRVALLVLALASAACGTGRTREQARPAGAPVAPRRLFVKAGCGDCHGLSDARTRGGAGPDFDTSERLDRVQLLRGLVEGANGMPSYAHRLTDRQRGALADYLLRVAWGGRDVRPRAQRAAGPSGGRSGRARR
jgi:mono/diheme cytochrome c family protein